VLGKRSRRGNLMEAARSTSQSYSASPSFYKSIQSTTLSPATELGGRRRHRTSRYLLCCT
jgi:hypothetical protein